MGFLDRFPTNRIPGVDRLSLDHELNRHFRRLTPGRTLDIGARHSPYRAKLPATEFRTADIDPSRRPDFCCDAHDLGCRSNYFDTVIATELLEHVREPQRVVDELWRVLTPGGTCILSTRFMCPYHPSPHDFYRFTWDSLRHLFRAFRVIEVHSHGNRAQVLWHIFNSGRHGVIFNIFNPLVARIRVKNQFIHCGYVVFARK
jgi:SAM-dependent methyltransferase